MPFKTELQLALGSNGEKEIAIFTEFGVPSFTAKTTDFFLTIQTDAWPKGVYIIRVDGDSSGVQKVVKF